MDISSGFKLWKVLCWNVRGLNSEKKWDSIRDKIIESRCDIISLQETKREHFDLQFIKKFCPIGFDSFKFLTSIGASGGLLTAWKSHIFHGTLAFSNDYSITVELASKHNDLVWVLTNIYAPCTLAGKQLFLVCLKNIQMPQEVNWLLAGDFNLLRNPEDRNKPGGDIAEMFSFNEALSELGVVEIPLYD